MKQKSRKISVDIYCKVHVFNKKRKKVIFAEKDIQLNQTEKRNIYYLRMTVISLNEIK